MNCRWTARSSTSACRCPTHSGGSKYCVCRRSNRGSSARSHGMQLATQLTSGDTSLDELDRLLRSDDAPPDCMLLSELDGFLTGIVVGPQPIMPSEWLPVVWGEGGLLADDRKAQAIVDAVLRRYDEIVDEIARDRDRADFLAHQQRRCDHKRLGRGFRPGHGVAAQPMARAFKIGGRHQIAAADHGCCAAMHSTTRGMVGMGGSCAWRQDRGREAGNRRAPRDPPGHDWLLEDLRRKRQRRIPVARRP